MLRPNRVGRPLDEAATTLGRCGAGGVDDVHPASRSARRHDLHTAVVAVEPDLGDQNADRRRHGRQLYRVYIRRIDDLRIPSSSTISAWVVVGRTCSAGRWRGSPDSR